MKKVLPFLLILALLISVYVIKTQKDYKDEMLKSFQSLEFSLNKSNENLYKKNIDLLIDFGDRAKMRPEEIMPYYRRAKKVETVAYECVKYIENLKRELAGKEPLNEETNKHMQVLNDNNFTRVINYFNQRKTMELLNKLNSTRIKLLDLLKDDEEVKLYSKDTAEISSKPYLLVSRYRRELKKISLAETITLLSKMQNDCRNMEADIIEVLTKNIGGTCGFIIDPLYARVIPNSNAIMVGSEYRAEVILLGASIDLNYEVIVNGKPLEKNGNIAIYTDHPEKEGIYDWEGFIKIKLNGGMKEYAFEAQYQAFQIGTTVTADNGNVIYTGIDNSVSISVPGYGHSDVFATISSGKMIKNLGWIARVNKPGTATISAFIRLKDGTLRNYGERMFRVKNIPTPESFFGTLKSGKYDLKNLQNQKQIIARLDNFQLEWTEFKVTKYSLSLFSKESKPEILSENGSEITPRIKQIISKAKTGDKIIIDEIMAKGPGGEVKLAPIVLTIQN